MDTINEGTFDAQLSETFSEIEKSLKVFKHQTKIVNLKDLRVHSTNVLIYHGDSPETIRALATNIEQFGLIEKIIINKDNEILSGRRRWHALQLLNIEKAEVVEIDINKEEELNYIISSNNQRVKTKTDMYNEIKYLYEKYSPGQGSRDGSGINTKELVSSITGYTTYEIDSIRKIGRFASELLSQIDNGTYSLNAAVKKAEAIEEKNTKAESEESVEVPQEDKVNIQNENASEETSEQPITELKTPEKPKAPERQKSALPTPMNCPCCGKKITIKDADYYLIRDWKNELIEFVNSLISKKAA